MESLEFTECDVCERLIYPGDEIFRAGTLLVCSGCSMAKTARFQSNVA